MSKVDLVVISSAAEMIGRCQDVCAEFDFTFESLKSVDDLMDREELASSVQFIILSAIDSKTDSDTAGMVQVLRQVSPTAYLMMVVDKKVNAESAAFIKKSGANIVLLENEFFNTSKLEFISSQKINASYLPAKVSEFNVGSKPTFTLFHLMPLNKKFMPVHFANNEISAEKFKKMEAVGEIYFRREDISLYQKYLELNQDMSAAGLKSRCRAQFLNLTQSYNDLVLLLTDQSESSSYQKGKELYEQCSNLANDLIVGLGAIGEAWDVINNSAVGTFGSVERGPAIAAYAGLFSLMTNIGATNDVMLGALLADVGMLDLPPKTTQKFRKGTDLKLNSEEDAEYRSHPIMSLNRALSRKLPIPENVKNIILCTHERSDKKGFPNQIRPEKIPEESMLIQFSEILDQACALRMGQERISTADAKKVVFDREYKEAARFSLLFLEKLRMSIF